MRSRRGGEIDEDEREEDERGVQAEGPGALAAVVGRGWGCERAAVEIGVAPADLALWIGEAASEAPVFVAVHVEDEVAERSGVVVVLGCGVRVEGLSVADLAELARRLA